MPKLLFLISEDWFFVSHFLPMARAAREAGFEVVVAARVRAHREPIEAAGCRVIPFEIGRGSMAPLAVLRGLKRAYDIVRAEKPDIVHCIALRMIILGGIPAKLAGARCLVLAPTGLGHLWISDGPGDRLMRSATRVLVVPMLRGPRTHFLFENAEDPPELGLDAGGRGRDHRAWRRRRSRGVSADAGAAGTAAARRGGGAHDQAQGHRPGRRSGAHRARHGCAGRARSLWRARSRKSAVDRGGRPAALVAAARHRLARRDRRRAGGVARPPCRIVSQQLPGGRAARRDRSRGMRAAGRDDGRGRLS